jgi:predicted hydrolase (HD superfamily)
MRDAFKRVSGAMSTDVGQNAELRSVEGLKNICGEDIPENVRELMLRNTQYCGSDAETPTRRALQRFEVLCLASATAASPTSRSSPRWARSSK